MNQRREIVWWSGLAVTAVVATAFPTLLVGVGSLVLVVAAWQWPEETLRVGVAAVLVVRPALDMFTERRLGLGPFAISPAALVGGSVLVLAVTLGIRRLSRSQRVWPERRLLVAHLGLFAAYAIGLASGLRLHGFLGLEEGVREVFRIVSVLGAFLMVLWWIGGDQKRYRQGWRMVVLGTLLPVSLSLWQLVTWTGNLEVAGINRLKGTFGHPNTLGPYLVPFILYLVGGMVQHRGRALVWRLSLAGGLSILLALTYSRTAILILATGLLALPLLHARRLGVRALLRGAAGIVLFLVLTWPLTSRLVSERFSGLRLGSEALEAARTGETENSLEWRLMNWGGLIALGLDHPVAGNGLNMTTTLNPLTDYATGIPYTSHDDFVRVFFEDGLLGLAAYVLYGLSLCLWALRQAREARSTDAPSAFAVAAALIALFFATGGTPEFGTQTVVQYEIYGMLALMTGLHAQPADDAAVVSFGDVTQGSEI